MRNWIKHVANSPGVQGLFAAFIAFAGLLLMAQAAWGIWQMFGPNAVPADVRVPDDVIIVGDLPEAPTASQTRRETVTATPIRVATHATPTHSVKPSIVPPIGAVAAASAAVTSTPAVAPTLSALTPAPVPSLATQTQQAAIAPDDTAPEFVWDSSGEGADGADVEVVDVQPAHLRASDQNRPTRLVIPSIRLDSPVVDVSLVISVQRGKTVSTWQVARDAVGFHNSSALPGTLGNAVMSAHNNAWGRIFRNLINVKRGDTIEVYAGNRVLRYTVEEKVLVRQSQVSAQQRKQNAAWIGPTEDERLTLVSCWPYRRPTHRIIIVARPA